MQAEQQPSAAAAGAGSWLRRWWPAAVVVALFTAVAAPLILTQHDRERGRGDQVSYHQPAILKMAEELPTPDVADYLTATTPGYHLVLAVVARVVSDSTVVMQAVGSLFTVVLLAVLGRWLTPRVGGLAAVGMTLAVAACPYVFSSGVFTLPDNAGWLAVLGLLLLGGAGTHGWRFFVACSVVFAALVFTRQSHAWAAGVVWAAAWLGCAEPVGSSGARALFRDFATRAGRTAVGVIATLPGLLVLGWFWRVWGGLTPPIYQGFMQGGNAATPAIVLVQFAVVGLFFAAWWVPGLVSLARARWWVVAGVAVLGVVLALAPETTFDAAAGRRTGVWELVRRAPVAFGRTSVVVAALAPVGALCVVGWAMTAGWRRGWLLVATVAAFMLGMSGTANSWTRYHLPLVVLVSVVAAGWAACGSEAASPGRLMGRGLRVLRLAGPGVLAAAFAAGTAAMNISFPRQPVVTAHPGASRPLNELWPRSWIERGPPPEVLGGRAAGGAAAGP